MSNRISSGEKSHKCFIGYNEKYKIKLFLIILPKANAYVESYGLSTIKWMYVLAEDEDLLKKFNHIWNTVSKGRKKESDSESIYKKKFLKTEIRYYR